MFADWGISAAYAVLAGAISVAALLFVLSTLRADEAPVSAPAHDLAI
jgi:hypothetical protein